MGTTLFEGKKGGSQALREKPVIYIYHFTFLPMEDVYITTVCAFFSMALHGLTWTFNRLFSGGVWGGDAFRHEKRALPNKPFVSCPFSDGVSGETMLSGFGKRGFP